MMKSIERGFVLVTVAFLWLAGCSAYADKKPNPPDRVEGDGASLRFDKSGLLVPVAKDGTPFKVCGDERKNTCSLFKENITITHMEPIMVTRFEHKINPTCVVYVVVHLGKQYTYFNPADPNCAAFNK
jgi:hypothetical protein